MEGAGGMSDDGFKANQHLTGASAVKLLCAASELVGGDKALAERLGIAESVLSRLMSGQGELSDPVLLGVVDIIVASHDSRVTWPRQAALRGAQDFVPDAS